MMAEGRKPPAVNLVRKVESNTSQQGVLAPVFSWSSTIALPKRS